MEQTHNEILRSLGRLEGKVDGISESISSIDSRTSKLEESVTGLKVSNGITTTKVSILGAIAGAAGSFLVSFLRH